MALYPFQSLQFLHNVGQCVFLFALYQIFPRSTQTLKGDRAVNPQHGIVFLAGFAIYAFTFDVFVVCEPAVFFQVDAFCHWLISHTWLNLLEGVWLRIGGFYSLIHKTIRGLSNFFMIFICTFFTVILIVGVVIIFYNKFLRIIAIISFSWGKVHDFFFFILYTPSIIFFLSNALKGLKIISYKLMGNFSWIYCAIPKKLDWETRVLQGIDWEGHVISLESKGLSFLDHQLFNRSRRILSDFVFPSANSEVMETQLSSQFQLELPDREPRTDSKVLFRVICALETYFPHWIISIHNLFQNKLEEHNIKHQKFIEIFPSYQWVWRWDKIRLGYPVSEELKNFGEKIK